MASSIRFILWECRWRSDSQRVQVFPHFEHFADFALGQFEVLAQGEQLGGQEMTHVLNRLIADPNFILVR